MKTSVLSLKLFRLTPYMLIGLMALSVAVYVFSINSIARHTALREAVEVEIRSLGNDVGQLESVYTAGVSGISLEMAREFGLVQKKSPVFVSRSGVATALVGSLNTN